MFDLFSGTKDEQIYLVSPELVAASAFTGDLKLLSTLPNKKKVDTEEFLLEINERLKKLL